ncbi:MAG: hypothetical protein ACOYN4_15390 [Bacteroidales bacterium]
MCELPFTTTTINGTEYDAYEMHWQYPPMSSLAIKCNGRMKEMFDDKELIRSLGRYVSDRRDVCLPVGEAQDGRLG